MESSTPPISSSNSADSNNIAQDPLALPNESSSGLYNNSNSNETTPTSQDHHEICGNLTSSTVVAAQSNNNSNNNNCSDKENNLNDGAIYSNETTIKHEEGNSLVDDRRLQFDSNHQIANSNYSSNDPRKFHHMSMQHLPQQQQHEPHKTFSHSIENLSKTTEKCTSNDMKM